MDTTVTVKALKEMHQLEVDALRAYDEVLKHISLNEIHRQISAYKGEHERHIEDIESMLQSLGERVPERKPDLKGLLIEGFNKIRAAPGNESALKAYRSNEKITSSGYRKALEKEGIREEVRSLFSSCLADEEKHLRFAENAISTRLWEHPADTERTVQSPM